jgi:hypothetical protein
LVIFLRVGARVSTVQYISKGKATVSTVEYFC